MRLSGLFLAASCAAIAQSQTPIYTIADPCLPIACPDTNAINDAGAFVTSHNLVYYPDSGLHEIAQPGSTANGMDMNNAGDVVGYITTTPQIAAPIAFLYNHRDFSWLNLNAFFDFPHFFPGQPALPALSINDLGNIAASSAFDPPAGLSNGQIVKINNAGQVIANMTPPSASFTAGVLLTPGKAISPLAGPVTAFNNRGQLIGSFGLYQPGQGTTVLPPGLTPARINDGGDIIGYMNTPCPFCPATHSQFPAVFRSSTHQLIYLQDALVPGSGWNLTAALAINNRGQIAVNATTLPPGPGSRTTTLILTP
jgi:hypothetical protein